MINKLLTKLAQRMIRRYLPETTELEKILSSPAYVQAIMFIEDAEKTKSLGTHKRDYVRAHLMAWYQKNSIEKPKSNILNLLIELALWRKS